MTWSRLQQVKLLGDESWWCCSIVCAAQGCRCLRANLDRSDAEETNQGIADVDEVVQRMSSRGL